MQADAAANADHSIARPDRLARAAACKSGEAKPYVIGEAGFDRFTGWR